MEAFLADMNTDWLDISRACKNCFPWDDASFSRANWTPAQPEPPAPVLCETCTNEGGLPCPMGNDYRGNVKVCASYEPKPTQPEPPAPCPQCNHPAHDNDCGVESLTAQPKPPAPDHIADTRKKVSDAPDISKGVWAYSTKTKIWYEWDEYEMEGSISVIMVAGVEFVPRSNTSVYAECFELVRRLAEWTRGMNKGPHGCWEEWKQIEREAVRLCPEAKGG